MSANSESPQEPAINGERGPINWRQIAFITLGAVALYLVMRALPTGTNLHQTDFSVMGKGALELCNPANPQFIPVVAARSPVTMTVTPVSGSENHFLLRLMTSTGKPVGPIDLLEVHTRLLHLLIVDPTLEDYQHIHPEPTPTPGEWSFAFTPRLAGGYRVFADFTPLATGRSLYTSAELDFKGTAAGPPPADGQRTGDGALHSQAWTTEREGVRFTLTPSSEPMRAGQPEDLVFTVERTDGHAVGLELVMGALAHLVAFDAERSGFAHLHPNPADPAPAADATKVRLAFKLTIPRAGRYVIWAQTKVGGHEVFVPFWFEVAP